MNCSTSSKLSKSPNHQAGLSGLFTSLGVQIESPLLTVGFSATVKRGVVFRNQSSTFRLLIQLHGFMAGRAVS